METGSSPRRVTDEKPRPQAWIDLRNRHLAFYRELIKGRGNQEETEDPETWIEIIEGERNNFRTALEWAFESRQIEAGLELATSLAYFWSEPISLSEGRRWLEQFLGSGEGSVLARARANDAAGTIAQQQGAFPIAVERAREAARLFREAGDEVRTGRALTSLGWGLWYSRQISEAVPAIEEAVGILRRTSDEPAFLARALSGLGWIAMGMNQPERSIEAHEEALALLREAGHKRALAGTLNSQAYLYENLGNYEAAAKSREESLKLFREMGAKRNMGEALSGAAWRKHRVGQTEEAWALFEELLQVGREVDQPYGVIDGMYGLAILSREQGNYALAQTLLTQALDELRRTPDPNWALLLARCWVLQELGNCVLLIGNIDATEQYFQEALVAARDTGRKGSVVTVLNGMANSSYMKGNVDRAIVYYEEAAALADEMQDPAFRQAAILLQSRLAGVRGDVDRAIALAEEAVRFAESRGIWHMVAWAKFPLAELLYQQGGFSMARAHLEESVGRLRTEGVGRLRSELILADLPGYLELLAATCGAAGDLEASERYFSELGSRWRALAFPESRSRLVETLASNKALREDWLEAARLIGAADRHREWLKNPRPDWVRPRIDELKTKVLGELGEEVFNSKYREGSQLSMAILEEMLG